MSFEIGSESRALYSRGSRRAVAGYEGLGSTAPAVATAPWMIGLPRASDKKDNTRIAYAKRDHDLALAGNQTAYANLKSQAAGSATRVGKAWYNAALADVNRSRTPAPAQAVRAFSPTVLPIIKQATDMGLKVQKTADGSVVAVDSSGAVVSKPLPVPTSAVTDNTVVPADAVQAAAPRVSSPSSGVFSIFDKLFQQTPSTPSTTSSDSFVASQGAPAPTATTPTQQPSTNTADVSGGAFGAVFQNPVALVGLAVAAYLFFSTSSGRRR